MTPKDIADGLDAATRQGAGADEPEGARFITISDTLASQMATVLRTWHGTAEEGGLLGSSGESANAGEDGPGER